jgi:membrane protease YdiL (CAAX protease family)
MNWKTKLKNYFTLQEINIDKKVLTVFISAAVILVLSEYYDSTSEINSLISWIFGEDIYKKYDTLTLINGDFNFQNLLNWGLNCIVVFLLLPMFIVKFIFKENLSEYGFQFQGIRKHLWIYMLLIIVMIPIVFFISQTPAFLSKYPFYHITQKEQLRYFLIWEIIYILQFVAIEFFFRGFLLHGIKHRFGYYAVLIAMIPYCMIHFGKPISETLGAIIAGSVLGFLSLNTNSIWLGILVHVTVAITMDFCALWHNGIFN